MAELEQLQGDLIEGVTALKNRPGDGTIGMSGSVSVVRQLLAAGLVDELHLLVHPIAVRKGLQLFDEESRIPLELISSEVLQRDRGLQPRLQAGRVDSRGDLRGCQGAPDRVQALAEQHSTTLTGAARPAGEAVHA